MKPCHRWYVWGRGTPRARLLLDGCETADAAWCAAVQGHNLAEPDAWAVEVVTAERAVERAIEGDAAVSGWTEAFPVEGGRLGCRLLADYA